MTQNKINPELVAEIKAHDKHTSSLSFVPGGRELIDLGSTGRIEIGVRVSSVAFDPLKNWLAVASIGHDVLVLEPDGSEVVRLATEGPVSSVGWTRDGGFLIGVGANVVRLWSREDWEVVRGFEVATTWLAPFALSSDSSLMAIGWEHRVGVWTADDDEPAAVIDGLPKGVYNLDFSEDGKLLAMGAADGRVRVWRV
jgi:WD40 repeat protein